MIQAIRDMPPFPPSTQPYTGCSSYFFPTQMPSENIQRSPGWESHQQRHPDSSSPVEFYEDPSELNELEASSYSRTSSLIDGDSPSPMPSESATPTASTKKKSRKASKSNYKHVPHREKPPHLVARRNARERRRVQAVNTAFSRLRKSVPAETRNKRLSKVKTLHRAIEYIQTLQEMLSKADQELGSCEPSSLTDLEDLMINEGRTLNKENELSQRWMPIDPDWDNDNHSSCLSFYDDFADQLQS